MSDPRTLHLVGRRSVVWEKCPHPGCIRLVPVGRWCPEHEPPPEAA